MPRTDWVELRTTHLSTVWEPALARFELLRTDRQDAEWINLATGARVALVQNGGWRQAETRESGPHEYSLFHMLQTPMAHDISDVLPHSVRDFDTKATGADTYQHARNRCIELIREQLGL
ncbi:hypothetical protein NHL51_01265 [Leucobacter sp. gxy201]|uniref:hypothetical protein n=1 Tax=Leucobacter sp. gxy201 TaxID=2957200 RepID=UPI003DA0AEA3